MFGLGKPLISKINTKKQKFHIKCSPTIFWYDKKLCLRGRNCNLLLQKRLTGQIYKHFRNPKLLPLENWTSVNILTKKNTEDK